MWGLLCDNIGEMYSGLASGFGVSGVGSKPQVLKPKRQELFKPGFRRGEVLWGSMAVMPLMIGARVKSRVGACRVFVDPFLVGTGLQVKHGLPS